MVDEMAERYEKGFPVSWDQLHRDARALAWRLAELGPWQSIVGGHPRRPGAGGDRRPRTRHSRGRYRLHLLLRPSGPALGEGSEAGGGRRCKDIADHRRSRRYRRHRAHRPRDAAASAHFACVYAKPAGRPAAHTFVTEVSQDTWIFFPWDTDLRFVLPIAEREAADSERDGARDRVLACRSPASRRSPTTSAASTTRSRAGRAAGCRRSSWRSCTMPSWPTGFRRWAPCCATTPAWSRA